MSSEQNDETSYQPSQPILCSNNCGFFGNSSTMNLCSKCYREVSSREEQVESAKAAMKKSLNPRPKIEAVSASAVEIRSPISAAVAIQAPISVDTAPSSSEVSGGEEAVPGKPNRCRSCNKKVGLVGFKCRCGSTYCGSHRYPENHECSFDFKELGRRAIEKANPVVKGSKLEKF